MQLDGRPVIIFWMSQADRSTLLHKTTELLVGWGAFKIPLQSRDRCFCKETMRQQILSTDSEAAAADSAAFGPSNPFYAPSSLPFQAPPFDRIETPITSRPSRPVWCNSSGRLG